MHVMHVRRHRARIGLLVKNVFAQLQPRDHLIHVGGALLRARADALHHQVGDRGRHLGVQVLRRVDSGVEQGRSPHASNG